MEFRRSYYFNNRNDNPFNSLVSILVMALVFIGLFVLARFIFRILYFLSPLMLIATLIIDHKVLINYARWLGDTIRRNALLGIGATVLSLVFFPVVAAGLLAKALLNREVRKAQSARQEALKGEYVDFEEIVQERPLQLPKTEPTPREKKKDERYDQFFN